MLLTIKHLAGTYRTPLAWYRPSKEVELFAGTTINQDGGTATIFSVNQAGVQVASSFSLEPSLRIYNDIVATLMLADDSV